MKDEIWKDCKHYEGLYQVSNYGRVKSLERDIVYKDGRKRHVKEHFLIQRVSYNGYLYVGLSKYGKFKQEKVHRLVAMAFISNPDNKPHINHIDEDKQNNYVDNLEWVTSKENNNYGNHNEKISIALKQTNKNKRGLHSQAKKVFCDGKIFDCIKDCADYLKTPYSTIKGYLSGFRIMPQKFIDMNLSYV